MHLRNGFICILMIGICLGLAAPSSAGASKNLQRRLARAIKDRDVETVRIALRDAGAANTPESCKIILKVAKAARDLGLFDDLVASLNLISHAEGLEIMVEELAKSKNEGVRFLLVTVLANKNAPGAHAGVVAAFADKANSVAIQAVRTAAGTDQKRYITPLIERLEAVEIKGRKISSLKNEIQGALASMTGESFEVAQDWRSWWKANESSFDPAKYKKEKAKNKKSDDEHTVIRRLKKRGDGRYIERLDKGDIIVVEGNFDKVESVLTHLKLPHTVVGRKDFPNHKLDPRAVLIFNCHAEQGFRFSDEVIQRIVGFVARGGYLFTSDWDLQNVAMRAFPKNIKMGALTQEHVFKIQPGRKARNHPLLRDVFPLNPFERANFTWKIDGSSSVGIPTKKSLILVESPDLAGQYGTPAVATYYRHRRGAGLHVMSHFEKQTDPKGDGFALQQLLLNFIVEKQRWRAQMGKKNKKKRNKKKGRRRG